MKKVLHSVTKTIKDASEDVARTMTETCKENNKAQANLNDKHLESVNDWVIIVCSLLSPFSKITSQYKLLEDLQSNRVQDLFKNETILVTPYDDLLTFRDTDEKFENRSFLKTNTNKNYFVDPAKFIR